MRKGEGKGRAQERMTNIQGYGNELRRDSDDFWYISRRRKEVGTMVVDYKCRRFKNIIKKKKESRRKNEIHIKRDTEKNPV